ncbi:MAG: hypothetical protein J6O04_03010 [Selenomonadaceae bacterium]|nr:hypothetical protein [Selenomonadaceae bacterium]
MVKFSKLFFSTLITIAVTANITYAASFVKMETVASFSQLPKMDEISGDVSPKMFSLNGRKLKLKPNLQFSRYMIKGGNVEILDAANGAKYASFPVIGAPYFTAKKLVTNTGEEFLYIQKGRLGASDSACDGVWLFGLHKGSYVTFADINTVKKAGLLYSDISSSIEAGELKLLGFTRDRNCVNGMFKGHSVYPLGANCGINSVFFFLDEKAQWFGIRNAD